MTRGGMRRGGMRRIVCAAGLVLLAGVAAAAAEPVAPDPAVYTCRVYVTGTDGRNRPAALEQCVRDVLVKLAGDPGLAEDERTALGPRAAGLVQDFAYLDLMTDIATHDEQGTRDRPFEFVGHVDPGGAAAVLRDLGRTPWTAPRPTLLVLVTITRGQLTFPLAGDGEHGERQRQALLAAAERFGLRVALPAGGSMPRSAGLRVLQGRIAWSDADFGWNATWQLDAVEQPWEERGVSYDAAFRSGVGGAAKRLGAR